MERILSSLPRFDSCHVQDNAQVQQPHAESEVPVVNAEHERESRKSISNAVAIPQFLKDKFPMPSDVVVTHVQHRTKTLPHFQARLPAGLLHQNK